MFFLSNWKRTPLDTCLDLRVGDLVGWRIPHYRERDGVGVVVCAEVVEIIPTQPWCAAHKVLRLEIEWQRTGKERRNIHFFQMPSHDPARSLWRYG